MKKIDDMVKFTVDYPGDHNNGKLSILDIEASVNKEKQSRIHFFLKNLLNTTRLC